MIPATAAAHLITMLLDTVEWLIFPWVLFFRFSRMLSNRNKQNRKKHTIQYNEYMSKLSKHGNTQKEKLGEIVTWKNQPFYSK